MNVPERTPNQADQRPNTFLSRLGLLRDEAETPLLQARALRDLGVNQLTPAGVVYLLASNHESAPVIEDLLGIPAQDILKHSRELLTREYSGTRGGFQPTPAVETLITQAITEAGGMVNAAGVEHLVLALYTAPGAKRTDAHVLLKELGVDETKVKERCRNQDLYKDRLKEIGDSDISYVPTQTAQKNLKNVLSRLNRGPGTRLLIAGENGSGKHTFLVTIARAMQLKELKGLKQTKMVEITPDLLARLQRQGEKRVAPLSQAKDTLVYADLARLNDQERSQLSELDWETPILAIGTGEEEGALWKNRWESVQLSPYDPDELAEILKMHEIIATNTRFLRLVDQEKITQLLLRYGRTFFRRALPGAAIELLRFAVADAELHGEKELTPQNIAQIVARHSQNISIEALMMDADEKILRVEAVLDERIIGQAEAKREIAKAVRIRASGLSKEPKPIASLVFLGPTGVGKTETAKALAFALFDNEENLIRFDMSEYQEPHTVARLIGSPPGYVGYDQGGQLTEAVRERPFSIVLLDEIDKAHPAVLNPLLQVLDDGRLTDGRGNTVDFSQTIVIMTSNHGSPFLSDAIERGLDMARVKRDLLSWFRKQMRPELINRIDSIVVFDPLSETDTEAILDLLLTKTVDTPLAEGHDARIQIDPAAKAELLRLGFDPQMGARPLRRVIREKILDPLASLILAKKLRKGERLTATVENGEIVVKTT